MSSDWADCCIGDLGRVITGKTPATENPANFGGEIPFLTPTDMEDGLKTVSTQRCLTEEGLISVKSCFFGRGVAVSCIGWKMGKSVLVERPTVTNQQINTVVVNEDRYSIEYVYYMLSSMRNKIFELGSTATRTPILNKTNFSKIKISVPPLKEQLAISNFLTAFDDRISLLRETNATLEAIAQALFKSWFVDFDPVHAKQQGCAPEGMDAQTAALFPDSFEESELGMVPKGWSVKPIGDLVPTVGGATPDTKNVSFWSPAEFHWTSPKDLSGDASPVLLTTEKKVSAAGLKKISSGLLPKGTLLMSSRAPIGYLALSAVPVAINQGYIAFTAGGKLSPLYMLFWCKVNMEIIKGNANGSTFMEISKKAFRPILALQPESNVLDAFEKVAGSLFKRLKSNEENAQILTKLRDALLPRLISGQLRLPEAQALVKEAETL